MGEGTTRVSAADRLHESTEDRGDRHEPRAIEREIETIRDELGGLLGELDRRRHEALDWRRQLRQHRRPLWIAAGVVGLTVGGYAGLRRRRRHLRRQRLASNARELLHALRVVAENPTGLARAVDARPRSTLAAGSIRLAGAVGPLLVRRLVRGRGGSRAR